jgi:alpha-D-xyloside xylohydrolase
LSFAPNEGERFYGMGENTMAGNVNLKGSVIDLYKRHVKAVVPFVVSNKMYGFLWNNPSLGRNIENETILWVWAVLKSGSFSDPPDISVK